MWGVVKTVFVGNCKALNTNLKSINRKINLITWEKEEIKIWVNNQEFENIKIMKNEKEWFLKRKKMERN